MLIEPYRNDELITVKCNTGTKWMPLCSLLFSPEALLANSSDVATLMFLTAPQFGIYRTSGSALDCRRQLLCLHNAPYFSPYSILPKRQLSCGVTVQRCSWVADAICIQRGLTRCVGQQSRLRKRSLGLGRNYFLTCWGSCKQ